MKDLTGYLKKTLLRISLFLAVTLLSLFSFNEKVYSQNHPFKTSASFVHILNGKKIDTELTVTLQSDDIRVLSIYTASILAKDINPACTLGNGSEIHCNSYKRASVTDIQMDLKNKVVGPENPITLHFYYSLPIQNELFFIFPSFLLDGETTEVKILYPQSLGSDAWVSETITSKEIIGDKYQLVFKKPTHEKLSVFFSKDIQYEFKINRLFSNQTEQGPQTFELVVPPDTQTQNIIWKEISPLPTSAMMDKDGNYIFKYVVPAKESIDCKIIGFIQKKQENNETDEGEIEPFLTKKIGYWDMTDSTEIKRVFEFMRNKGLDINENVGDVSLFKKAQRELFYEYLYQYIIYRLDYQEDIPLGIGNEARLGSVQIAKKGRKFTPVDYSDFYISLLRYFGIPSRMVLGYVSNIAGYTTDGFYHYWVEYYDSDKKHWISVDPFIEEYSKQSLFGANLEDHVEIIKRGFSPLAPTLTFYTPTDFQVNLNIEERIDGKMDLNADFSFNKYDPTQKYITLLANLSNTGNIAISNVSFDKSNMGRVNSYIDPVSNIGSEIILPKQNKQMQLNIPYNKIASRNIYSTILYSNNFVQSAETKAEAVIPEDVPLYTLIIAKILSLASFLILILVVYISFKFMKSRKWNQQSS